MSWFDRITYYYEHDLWDKQRVRNVVGKVLTAETLYKKYPHISPDGGVLLEYISDTICGGIDSLDILKQIYDIDSTLPDEEAAEQIIDLKLNPPPPGPSEDERIEALEAAMLDMILGGAL